jgi:hypothetical protein
LLDLDWFGKLLTTGSEKMLTLPFQSLYRGLCGFAEMVLGKPLDKRDQVTIIYFAPGGKL